MADEKPSIDIPEKGPFLVKGLKKLTDAQNNPVEMEKEVIALCRCGASKSKPFCDGAHSEIGFSGEKERQETYDTREFEGKELTASWHVATASGTLADEYAVLLVNLLDMQGIDKSRIDGAVYASVVPTLSPVFGEMFAKLFNVKALRVAVGVKTGMRIQYEPRELGPDRIANFQRQLLETQSRTALSDYAGVMVEEKRSLQSWVKAPVSDELTQLTHTID